MLRVLTIVLLSGLGQATSVEPDATPEPQRVPTFAEMLDEMKQGGSWEENAEFESQAVDLFFERNGWTSPEDEFARDVMHRVGQVPPWQQAERQNAFLDAVSDRYTLSTDQRRLLNRRMQMESMRMTMNHFIKVAPMAMEMIKTRGQGKPFTPDMIARWTKVIRPIAEDGRESMERVARELGKTMSDEQRDKLELDIKAFVRRHNGITDQMTRWEEGGWTADDWGMTHDPIQNGERLSEEERAAYEAQLKEQAAAAAATERELSPEEKAKRDEEEIAIKMAADQLRIQQKLEAEAARLASNSPEHVWAKYTRDFANAHEFTDEQRKSANGILQDMLRRAERWNKSHARKNAELQSAVDKAGSPAAKQKAQQKLVEAQQPIENMFEELKARLSNLLTAKQRVQSEKP